MAGSERCEKRYARILKHPRTELMRKPIVTAIVRYHTAFNDRENIFISLSF